MADVLAEAQRLRKLGFAVHWLRSGTKAPIAANWSDAPVMSEQALNSSYQRGLNVGFRPGKWTVVAGMEVCVLDIDIRGGAAYAEEAYAAAKSMLKGAYQPHVVTGSVVGRHQYLAFHIGSSPVCAATTLRQSDVWVDIDKNICHARDEGARPAWVIEILSTGKNVVLPPSIHPDTGKPYIWAEG